MPETHKDWLKRDATPSLWRRIGRADKRAVQAYALVGLAILFAACILLSLVVKI